MTITTTTYTKCNTVYIQARWDIKQFHDTSWLLSISSYRYKQKLQKTFVFNINFTFVGFSCDPRRISFCSIPPLFPTCTKFIYYPKYYKNSNESWTLFIFMADWAVRSVLRECSGSFEDVSSNTDIIYGWSLRFL